MFNLVVWNISVLLAVKNVCVRENHLVDIIMSSLFIFLRYHNGNGDIQAEVIELGNTLMIRY